MVEGAQHGMDILKAEVMKREGYRTDAGQPENVKYEVAKTLGVPLEPGYNGKLTTEDAGRVGGPIGGAMVREMVRMAKAKLEAGSRSE